MHTHIISLRIPLCITQNPPPREWCHPQWVYFPLNYGIQDNSPMDMLTDHLHNASLTLPSQVTLDY